MRNLILLLAAFVSSTLPPYAISADLPPSAHFAYLPGSANRYINLECQTSPIDTVDRSYPGVTVSTNLAPSSPLENWNVDYTLSLALPYPTNGSVSVFAHGSNIVQFSDSFISGGFGAYGGANSSGSVPGFGRATTGLEISFTVSASVAYQLDVYKVDSIIIPQLTLWEGGKDITPYPTDRWSGDFKFDGTFEPDTVYRLTAYMSSLGSSGNVDPAAESFTLTLVPEPNAAALFGLGLLTLLLGKRHHDARGAIARHRSTP